MTPTFLVALLLAPAQAPTTAPSLTARVEYYLTEVRVLSPDGKALGAMVGLGKREYRPADGTIEQMDIALDPAPGALPTVVVLEWTVADDGASAEIASHDGRVKGRAKLTGPRWSWTEWSWTGTMKDVPGTFRNATRVTRRGLATRSERVDDAGKRVEVYDQFDTKITKETYDVLRARLLPQ
jgi:hypothetical protein